MVFVSLAHLIFDLRSPYISYVVTSREAIELSPNGTRGRAGCRVSTLSGTATRSAQHVILRALSFLLDWKEDIWETGNIIRHGADGKGVRQHLGKRYIWGCHCFCCHFDFDITRGCVLLLFVLARRRRKPNYCRGRLTGWSMTEVPHIFSSHFVFFRSLAASSEDGIPFPSLICCFALLFSFISRHCLALLFFFAIGCNSLRARYQIPCSIYRLPCSISRLSFLAVSYVFPCAFSLDTLEQVWMRVLSQRI